MKSNRNEYENKEKSTKEEKKQKQKEKTNKKQEMQKIINSMQQQIEKLKDIITMICSMIVKDDNIKKVVESQLQEINNEAINEENNKEIITD